jgi:hypothetical protein
VRRVRRVRRAPASVIVARRSRFGEV